MNGDIDKLVVDETLVEKLNFSATGLIPAVVVDEHERVLMVAYMDPEALRRTLRSARTWFYSRSREQYWAKGETSGNIQSVIDITTDCDYDTLLVKVHQHGQGACHTGSYSCFGAVVATSDTNHDARSTLE